MKTPHTPRSDEEVLAAKLHSWYLEATKEIDPANYNSNAQKSYTELNEEQQEIDRFIARKILAQKNSQTEQRVKEAVGVEREKICFELLNYRDERLDSNVKIEDIVKALTTQNDNKTT